MPAANPETAGTRCSAWPSLILSLLLIFAAWCTLPVAMAQSSATTESASGPVRLRQPGVGTPAAESRDESRPRSDDRRDDRRDDRLDDRLDERLDDSRSNQRPDRDLLPRLTEFEQLVRRITGDDPERPIVRRFGAQLARAVARDAAGEETSPAIPPDYLVKPGDEVLLTIWGSVDADLRLLVDRTGRIGIPRIGAVTVAGVRYADLADTISRRAALVFKNFQLTATLGRLRGVRVFVTGFVERPGAITVGSLSSVTHALLKAGGPAEAGSFRDIQLRRGGRVVASLDFYRLLLAGDRSADLLVEADDVIHVGPVGPQAAIIGSVNQSAIFELRPGEGLAELLRMAGGFNAVADRSRVAIERLDDRANVRVVQVELSGTPTLPVMSGDVVRVFSAAAAVLPVERQNKRVRVEGEVARPGDYVLPPNSSITDALQAAGGLTTAAYVFGTEFSRESVRQTQQNNYERALRDMETDFARTSASQRTSTAEDVSAQTASAAATARLIQRLRAVRPTGRVVLQVPPDATALPELALEDGDRLYIPPRPTTVGVFGSVFNAGSYLHTSNRSVDEYLRLAGGPTRGADVKSVFVIRANGTVISELQQDRSWFTSNNGNLNEVPAQPGDTVFVPEEMNKTTFVQDAKDWTQIIYQLGIGVAALLAIGN